MKKQLIISAIATLALGVSVFPLGSVLTANASTTDVIVDVKDTITVEVTGGGDGGDDVTDIDPSDPNNGQSLSDGQIKIELSPKTSEQVSSTKTEKLSASTNSAGGLSIKAKTSTTDGSLTKLANNQNAVSGGPIKAITVDGTTPNNNNWGIKFANDGATATNEESLLNKYVGLTGTEKTIAKTTTAGTQALTASYTASVNNTVAAGTYKTTVTYTVAKN